MYAEKYIVGSSAKLNAACDENMPAKRVYFFYKFSWEKRKGRIWMKETHVLTRTLECKNSLVDRRVSRYVWVATKIQRYSTPYGEISIMRICNFNASLVPTCCDSPILTEPWKFRSRLASNLSPSFHTVPYIASGKTLMCHYTRPCDASRLWDQTDFGMDFPHFSIPCGKNNFACLYSWDIVLVIKKKGNTKVYVILWPPCGWAGRNW